MKKEMLITEADAGSRLDRWFKRQYPDVTQGLLQKWLRKGDVRVNGKKAEANKRLEEGMLVTCSPLEGITRSGGGVKVTSLPSTQSARADLTSHKGENKGSRPLSLRQYILYEDARMLALNKPPGLAVQGGTKVRESVDDWLDTLAEEYGERPHLVHRLDKDTSGVLLIAKTARAARDLTAAFRRKETDKVYWALVVGVPAKRAGVIDLPLAKGGEAGAHREKVGVSSDGKRAITEYKVRDTLGGKVAWLELRPITGRTHQLRVHCAALGHPILGDGKYGGREAYPEGVDIPKQLHLHARSITLPGGKKNIEISAGLPGILKKSWKMLGFTSGT